MDLLRNQPNNTNRNEMKNESSEIDAPDKNGASLVFPWLLHFFALTNEKTYDK